MLNVTINGERRTLAEPITVSELLRELSVSPEVTAVEVNRTIVPRSCHDEKRVENGDEIEVVTFVGGG